VFHGRPDLDMKLLNPRTTDGPAVAGKGHSVLDPSARPWRFP
jgi:hypothetical protein